MTPGFTLRTYTHSMPSGETRTRAAVDRDCQDDDPAEAGPETAQGPVQAPDPRLSQYPKFCVHQGPPGPMWTPTPRVLKDRKSTRLNSSHVKTSYAVFCLKKK